LAKHIGKLPEEIEADISRPKYFSPTEAVEYGIIDKVLLSKKKIFCFYFSSAILNFTFSMNFFQVIYNERTTEDRGVVSDLKKAQLI
jgi:ATP-dependent Clp protease protease subunit